MATRTMRLSTSDATSLVSNSKFVIDIGNVQGLDECRGCSVECVGFANCHPNVEEDSVFTVLGDGLGLWGASQSVTVARGQYTFAQLAAAITSGLDGVVSIVLNARGFAVLTGDANFTAISGSAWKMLGFSAAQLGALAGTVVTAQLIPGLAGLQVAYLHSTLLSGKGSLDGQGSHQPFICPIPITSAFGELQTYMPVPLLPGFPMVPFRDPVSVRTVDIDLQTHEGLTVDIGASELWVILRLWF